MLTAAILILLFGCLLSAFAARRPRIASGVFLTSLILGCLIGILSPFIGTRPETVELGGGWNIPWARLILSLDGLSAFFLVATLIICLLSGIYGETYTRQSERLAQSVSIRPLFLLLTASLAVVVCAQNAVLFLFAWEAMALSSFFLVIIEDEKKENRFAGLLYFVCMHISALALFFLFSVLGKIAGTLDFGGIRAAMALGDKYPILIFSLAAIGFGLKAGTAPLHIWLQEAHPSAPSHVSAVMSGVVIKMGIYGFLRLIWILRLVPGFWAIFFIGTGLLSGIGGVLLALLQHDLKRLLAYHSVENIGIICLGMGLGCLGISRHNAALALLGFSGALFHVFNHALFKSLLFLGSGAFYQALGTRDIEAGGGLLKKMPWTSATSLIAAAAISGLPPLNGFISEWLIYMAGLKALAMGETRLAAVSIAGLALIGGLALACFTKAYGALCLGLPRTKKAQEARDPGPGMIIPMSFLAAFCALIGLWPSSLLSFVKTAAMIVSGEPLGRANLALSGFISNAEILGLIGAAVLSLAAAFSFLRSRLISGFSQKGATWACGFTALGPRMQYTASSYVQVLMRPFSSFMGTQEYAHLPRGYWPTESSFKTNTPDPLLDGFLIPAVDAGGRSLSWIKRKRRARLQYSLLWASLFLLALLAWKL